MRPGPLDATRVKYRPWTSRFDPDLRATANLSETYRGHRFAIFISRSGLPSRSWALYIDGEQVAVDLVGPSNADTIVAGVILAKRLIDLRISPESAPARPANEAVARIRRPTPPTEIVSIAQRMGQRDDDAALALVRLIAEHCAELADESGPLASGPEVGKRIRQLFRL